MKHLLLLSLFLVSTLANAQTVCDSLDFVSIKYSPFTDSVIIVHVQNNNQNEIFDYPGFVILNDNDDTVAVETVFYFGIGQESVHTLNVRPGMHDPLDNFTGTLKLYSGFFSTYECEWNLDQSLCADVPCDSVVLGFQNWGGALVTGDFAWNLKDADQMTVASGTLTMTTTEQYWFHSLCVEPGMYTYSLTALGSPSGGGPTLTVSASTTFASPNLSEPLDWFNDPGAELQFPFFQFCAQSPNAVDDAKKEESFIVSRTADQLLVQHTDVVNSVEVFGLDGRLVRRLSPNATAFVFPSELGEGVYLLRIGTENRMESLKLFW